MMSFSEYCQLLSQAELELLGKRKREPMMVTLSRKSGKSSFELVWVMYQNFIHEGFTKQQAMSLVKTMLSPKIGGNP